MYACRILARLLTYPDPDFMAALPAIEGAILAEPAFGARERAGLLSLVRHLRSQDLIEVEEGYVGLFDRVRSLSLHLFEHVHGESRARGQAPDGVRVVELPRQGLDLGLRRAGAGGELAGRARDLDREEVGEAHEPHLHRVRVGGLRARARVQRARTDTRRWIRMQKLLAAAGALSPVQRFFVAQIPDNWREIDLQRQRRLRTRGD